MLEHVGQIFRLQQVIDRDDLDVGKILHRSAEHHAADAAETIDANLDSHGSISCGLLGQDGTHGVHHVLRGEPEMLEQHAGGRAFAVAVEADDGGTAVLPPAVGDAGFHRHARQPGREHGLLVLHILAVEHGGAGHADHAHRDLQLRQLGLRVQRQLHLGAGGDDDGLRLLLEPHLAGLGQHIGAFGDVVQARLGRVRQVLA